MTDCAQDTLLLLNKSKCNFDECTAVWAYMKVAVRIILFILFVLTVSGCSELPSEAGDAYIRGQMHENAGEYRYAMEAYTLAIELDPELPGAYYRRAKLYMNRGSDALALADLKQFLALLPDSSNQGQTNDMIQHLEQRLNE